ncbi:hypothetical protein D9M68_550790 [compost metagenome]
MVLPIIFSLNKRAALSLITALSIVSLTTSDENILPATKRASRACSPSILNPRPYISFISLLYLKGCVLAILSPIIPEEYPMYCTPSMCFKASWYLPFTIYERMLIRLSAVNPLSLSLRNFNCLLTISTVIMKPTATTNCTVTKAFFTHLPPPLTIKLPFNTSPGR